MIINSKQSLTNIFFLLFVTVRKLTLKWKNLKDNFSRNLRKRSKSGQPVGAGRKYIYEKHLSFLQQTMALAMTQSSSAEEPSLDSPISQGSHHEEADTVLSSDPQVPPGPSNKSRRRQELESSLITFMNAPVVVEPPDQHRSFFESMVPLIQNFSEEQTLQFRAGVIDLIRQIKRQPAETQSAVLSPPQSSVFNRSMPQNYYPIPQHNFQQYSQPINFPSPHPMPPACPTPDHSIVAGSNISSTPSQTSPSSEYAFGHQM